MEDSPYGFSRRKAALESEDLQEEEVWAMMKAREGSSSNSNSKARKNVRSGLSSSSAWRFNSATPRSIPRSTADGGGPRDSRQQSSAPVDIPDWSKIMKKRGKKNLWDDAPEADADDDCGDGSGRFCNGTADEVEGDDDEMVPPHEYLARRLASTQIASFSMCEGVGRTLKGRDLSKLRTAILSKTGFIE